MCVLSVDCCLPADGFCTPVPTRTVCTTQVLSFSSFECLDAGLSDEDEGGGRRGLLRTIFGFGGGGKGGDDGSGSGTPMGDDPRATSVSIAAVKALLLSYVAFRVVLSVS